MIYQYKQLDEPQKSLLLSLVRIGFSLSDDNVICLTENQSKDFDFQAINEFNNINAFKPTIGELKYNQISDDIFKIDKNINIEISLNEIDGKIKNIATNGNNIFIYILTDESTSCKHFYKMPYNKLNFNDKNIYINEKFNLEGKDLYEFLKKFNHLSKLLKNEEYKDCFKIYIEGLKYKYIKPLDSLRNIIDKGFSCEICQVKNNNSDIILFICNNHFFHLSHVTCIQNNEKNKKYEEIIISHKNCKQKIFIVHNKIEYDKILNLIKGFFLNDNDFKDLEDKIMEKINNLNIMEKINNLKKKRKKKYKNINNMINNMINDIIQFINKYIDNNENNIIDEKICLKCKTNSLMWKNDLISKINTHFNSKKKNITSWIEYEKVDCIQEKSKEIKYLYTYKIYNKNFSNCIVKLFTFYQIINEEKYCLKFKDTNKWDDDIFENYFESKNHNILIQKNNDYFEVNLKNYKTILFNGCYDYNDKMKILILTNLTNIEKNQNLEMINIYYLDENNRIIDNKGYTNYYWGITKKIIIIPLKFNESFIYSLFFNELSISLVNLENFEIIHEFNISKNYNNYNKDYIQYLVQDAFLLIIYLDENDGCWKCDLYSIQPNNDEDTFHIIEKGNILLEKSIKNCKYSICKIEKENEGNNNNIILYYCYINNEKLFLEGKKIIEKSSFSIESKENKIKECNFKEGNCIFNYFYHAFKKFPAIGALQYNYYINHKIIKNIYLFSNNLKLHGYKEYFNELKRKCIVERGLDYDDLNYEFKGRYKFKKIINKIGLGSLLIKFIEAIPIQIAKIKNFYFKAMSNGKDIIVKDLYEKYLKRDISIQEKADYIDFGIKNSIFNYYDLPVIVLCYMGVQSIGKSTLSNEISVSLFNVSGMRCTEGIWMAVSLFNPINYNNQCKNSCKYCYKNKCCLLYHKNDIKCICEECSCNERCCLFIEETNIKKNQNFCKKRCALPKGHNKDLDHICEVSPYNHGFICVSLDFEGLGTFERSLEQDIDLAMVGAAMGNSIILRVDKAFDKYMESRMVNWSEGSKNINTTKSSSFFGGNLIFSQKDALENDVEEVKKEFNKKINASISKWYNSEIKRKIRELDLNLPIFGIFNKFINSPTPQFNKNDFHYFLRNEFIHLIIKDVLIKKSLPKYRTGCEFMNSLKIILATIDIHDYNVLDSITIDNLKNYIINNKNNALEIFGIYSKYYEINISSFEEFEKNLISNLEILKFSFISNNKPNIEEILKLEIKSKNDELKKNKKIKIDDLLIKLKPFSYKKSKSLSKKKSYKYNKIFQEKLVLKKKIHSPNKDNKTLPTKILNNKFMKFSKNQIILTIEGMKEYGLLLLIPFEYKAYFSLEDIRKKLFTIWKKIGNNINLTDYEIINNFEFFIEAIIKRREKNVKNWINNLTSNFNEESIKSLKNINYYLKDKWIICKEKCYYCYYKCSKILGHDKEHNCGLDDHYCHEKCQKCLQTNCDESDNCDHLCQNQKAGHKKEMHSCGHQHKCKKICSKSNLRQCSQFCNLEIGHNGNCLCDKTHLCNKKCIYNDNSEGCKIYCNLEIDHEGEHLCESKMHKCCLECSFKNISKGCINKGICILNLPHSINNHNCGGNHKCIKICHLKNVSRNCEGECFLPFGHSGSCICQNNHICKEFCELNGIAKRCKIECRLNYGHDLPHNCNEMHICNDICFFKKETKSKSCINEGNCILPYNHQGKCSCGQPYHLCFENCSKNCGRPCQLISGHKENLHDCKEFHPCLENCSLEKYSKIKSCEIKCKYELGHEGFHECIIPKENHHCKKNCKNCENECGLIAGHEGDCYCGKKTCTCSKDCKFINKSHNCKKICKKSFLHEGEHLCEEKIHLCNYKCIYSDKSRKNQGCLIFCCLPCEHDISKMHFCGIPKKNHICSRKCSLFENSKKGTCSENCILPIEHESPCLCEISKDKHLCNKECSLKGKKGCTILCSLNIFHEGECICSVGKDKHICDKECTFYKNSRLGCKERCILKYDHENSQCMCSADLNAHIHNGECCLKSKSREGCSIKCKLPINHDGKCICENSPELHICKENCDLMEISFEGSCNKFCILKAGHDGEHKCCSEMHECKEDCKYKSISKAGCLGHCCKKLGHKEYIFGFFSSQDHICKESKEKHICKENCNLKNKSRIGCKGSCDKPILHDGQHLCNSDKHICKELCYYNEKSIGCQEFCNKNAGHKDKHECSSKIHLCKGKCYLQNFSRGCFSDCILKCEHNGNCICKKKENEHLCNQICRFCSDFCCYNSKHEGIHLCNNEHECNHMCEENGYCEIKTNTNIDIKKSTKTFKFKNSDQILEYVESSEQTYKKNKCTYKILKGQINHNGLIHKCEIKKHKCGFKCKLCDRLCELEFGHKDLHFCKHGHIKNAIIQTEEKTVKLNFKEKEYIFENNEVAIIFTCYQYCKDQKRHIHRLDSNLIQNKDENIKNGNIRKFNKYLYECKCEYFWKSFLQFRFESEFEKKLKDEFNKCPAKCKLCDNFKEKIYCELNLWHKNDHKFSCEHHNPKPCHTIFIIDKSDSMGSQDLKPIYNIIKKNENFNNRLGCVLQVIDNYIKKRLNIDNDDLFSLIAFSSTSQTIFSNYDKNLIKTGDWLNMSMSKIEDAYGNTYFLEGLKEGNKILSQINRQKYKPIIILLSDGENKPSTQNETLNYVKDVRI